MSLPLLHELRAKKSKRELEAIRRSGNITAETFSEVVRSLRPGITEAGLAQNISRIMERRGAEALAFSTIVAFGTNTANIHHSPTEKKLGRSSIVMLDFGAVVGGYSSDMTRTLCFGTPDKKFILWYKRVLAAQKRALGKVREGARGEAVDRAARNYLAQFPGGRSFPHGTGHGVGLAIHEWPYLRKKSKDVLRARMAVTVEPGTYFKGWGGIRIEDTVLVKKSGSEVLTNAPKSLEEIVIP
ncbi:M24 family metallopeptidase [Candidatus Parcubacteria bacterium]|nr:MAG: M24 family metallopeptidase [Candidatus Parcubacteria bacterium]